MSVVTPADRIAVSIPYSSDVPFDCQYVRPLLRVFVFHCSSFGWILVGQDLLPFLRQIKRTGNV